jgi:Zn-dependent protease/CBS domain-containing protein
MHSYYKKKSKRGNISMKASFQIGKIIGIPIKVHFTFILILLLFAWAFSAESYSIFGFTIGFNGLPLPFAVQLLFGGIIAVFLFICVLLHELGHSYITQKFGYKINGITLFIFGGVSQTEELPRNPKQEMGIAIIGPAVSFFIGVILYLVYIFINQLGTSLSVQIVSISVGTLAFYNFLLAGFNLIPAFPIDGGRVLRAGLAMRMDYSRATRVASGFGKGIAIFMAIFGIFYNLWLTFIAIFIYFGASQEQQALGVSLALENVKVKDIMSPNVESISPDLSLREFSEYMFAHKHLGYPVIENRKIIGTVSVLDIRGIGKNLQDSVYVKDVMHKDYLSISPDDDAIIAFKTMARSHNDRLIVQNHDQILGIISWSDVLHAIKMRENQT